MKTKLTLLALTLGAAACGADEPGRVEVDRTPVDVVVAAPVMAPSVVTYAAEVTAERTADIATRMSGAVREVHAEIGSRVRRGDRLVSLDARDVFARVEAARAAFELAEKSHGRIERLAADGAASTQELDRSTAGLEAARSALAEAEAQEAYAVVTAPFDGVVTARRVEPGDLASPGMPLFSMVDPASLKVVADLPAHLVGAVREGARVQVEVVGDAGVGPVSARVSRVVPAVAGGGRTFRIEAVPTEALEGAYPGAYARLSLPSDGGGTRWIPADAVVERGQLTGIYTVEDDVLRLRWVRLGARRADAVELLSGPAGELRIVRSPDVGFTDGQPVGAARDEEWTLAALAAGETNR